MKRYRIGAFDARITEEAVKIWNTGDLDTIKRGDMVILHYDGREIDWCDISAAWDAMHRDEPHDRELASLFDDYLCGNEATK